MIEKTDMEKKKRLTGNDIGQLCSDFIQLNGMYSLITSGYYAVNQQYKEAIGWCIFSFGSYIVGGILDYMAKLNQDQNGIYAGNRPAKSLDKIIRPYASIRDKILTRQNREES